MKNTTIAFILGLLLILPGCTNEITSPNTCDITAENYQSEFEIIKDCKLIVNGKEIEGAVIGHIDYTDDFTSETISHVAIPYVAFLEALGAEVQWSSNTDARVSIEGKEYTLDTYKGKMIPVGKTEKSDVLLCPPGGYKFYQAFDKEMLLSEDVVRATLTYFGLICTVSVEGNNSIIRISVVENNHNQSANLKYKSDVL